MVLQNLKSLTDIANMAAGASQQVLTVPLGDVESKDQVRKKFVNIEELAASMKAEGQQSPIIVSPKNGQGKYVIQKGERRWRALNQAGIKTVDIIVRAAPKDRAEEIAGELVENIQRDDLKSMEIASGIGILLDEGMSRKQIAERLGKSPAYVTIMLSLRKVPKAIQDLYDSDLVSDPHTLYALKQIWEVDEAFGARVCSQVKKHEGISRTKARELLKSIKDPGQTESEEGHQQTQGSQMPDGSQDGGGEQQPETQGMSGSEGQGSANVPTDSTADVGDDGNSLVQPSAQTNAAISSAETPPVTTSQPEESAPAPTQGPVAGTASAGVAAIAQPAQAGAAAVVVRIKVACPDGPAMGVLLLNRADRTGDHGWVKLDDEPGEMRVSLGDITIVELRAAN